MSPAATLAGLLTGRRFLHSSELELQDGIASVLTAADVPFEREAELAKGDVIDFLVSPGVGLEVKVGGSRSELLRQLHRYAEHDQVLELLVVTSRMRLSDLPSVLLGKPLRVVALLGGLA